MKESRTNIYLVFQNVNFYTMRLWVRVVDRHMRAVTNVRGNQVWV